MNLRYPWSVFSTKLSKQLERVFFFFITKYSQTNKNSPTFVLLISLKILSGGKRSLNEFLTNVLIWLFASSLAMIYCIFFLISTIWLKKNNWMSVDKQGTISLSFLTSEYSFFKFSISQDLAKYGIPPARYQLTIVLNLSFCPWSARLFLDFDIYWALQSFFLILPLFGHPSTEEIFREYFWMGRGWLGLKAEWLITRQCFSLESVTPSHQENATFSWGMIVYWM